MKNVRLEPVIPVAVQPLPAEPASPGLQVLAHVMEGGYRQQVVGRVSDLPATVAWLEERGIICTTERTEEHLSIRRCSPTTHPLDPPAL